MEVYVKESLHVLDYKDNIVDSIFLSDDKNTPGYAYDLSITESNTGYSDLTFSMPNLIISEDGSKIKNPKLSLMTPLVKLRYNRKVIYIGKEPITVREPSDYGDDVGYVDKTYSSVYPDNIIEDYVMDYIVQPVDSSRTSLQTSIKFTAIDYPRFTLSKKKVGLTISQDVITDANLSLFQNKPIDSPGVVKYQQWTLDTYGSYSTVTEWDPAMADDYPIGKEGITRLMANTAIWPYGLLGTVFYWPIVSTGRFQGTLYKKGGFLLLNLYDFYNLSTKVIDPNSLIDRYSWEWSQMAAVDSYLCPNNADNYLKYVLKNTNWTIKQKKDANGNLIDDVDIVKKTVSNPSGSTFVTTTTDYTNNISLSGGNCYNGITAIAKGMQLYPIFDCINKQVSLKVFSGKNYGLVYRVGDNVTSDSVTQDGEKIITKLYASGGKDNNGDSNITIGEAQRTYTKKLVGMYTSVSNLPSSNVEGLWAIVDPQLTESYWITSPDRKVYGYNNVSNLWNLGQQLSNGNWSVTINGAEYIIDPISGVEAPWDPNDTSYIMARSPYQTNYILNLKWAYQQGWITEPEILELYQMEMEIHNLNTSFVDKYVEDRKNTLIAYNTAVNNYSLAQDSFDSTLHSMENKYYNDDTDTSKGYFYAFPAAPMGTFVKGDGLHYIKMYHCNNKVDGKYCGYTSTEAFTTCPNCGNTVNITSEDVYIPIYSDFSPVRESLMEYPDAWTKSKSEAYTPHIKGGYQKLITTLDNVNGDLDVTGYEALIYITKGLVYDSNNTFDGKHYIIYDSAGTGVYVSAASGAVENWNQYITDYIKNYGNMKDCLAEVNEYLNKISELDEQLENWQQQVDAIQLKIQNKFGDYLVEGNYTNDEQPYPSLLFDEGLEASDKYATPEVTYTLSVIDSCGLIEYREPNVTKYECVDCDYCTTKEITTCPKCGSQNIEVIFDVYNDLVNSLHSVGQIVPKAGDYVKIYDEQLGLYGIPGLITEIKRVLDDPSTNSIKIDTSYTDDEELVGNIINATNTVLNNSDIYARTAIINADGTIDSTSMKDSLDNTSSDITIVSTNGNILLNGSGLRATDPSDPTKALKYAGNGIFKTTTLSENGESTSWEKVLDQNGINATYINSGTIDTGKINVVSGLYGKVLLDQYGLTVKNDSTKSSHITAFSNSDALTSNTYASNWGTTNNIASFIGVDLNNKPLIYTKGILVAEKGSNIAGWITEESGFHDVNGDLWLSTSGVSKTVNGHTDNYAIYSKGNFGVNTSGQLYATNANLKGYIEADSGKIGGWTINSTSLSGNGTISGGTISGSTVSGSSISGGSISGTSISGGTISGGAISGGSVSGTTLTGSAFNAGTINIANKFKVNGSLYGPELSNTRGGFMTFDTYINPYCSGLNVASSGIRLSDGSSLSDGGTDRGTISIQSGHLWVKATTNDLVLNGYHVFLEAREGNVYAQNNSTSRVPVATDSGGVSSLKLKTNVKIFNEEDYSDAYNLMKDIDLYHYDYKYNISEIPNEYGFIIDYVEKDKGYDKFLSFKEMKAKANGKDLDYATKEGPGVIDFKKFNQENLTKFLMVVIKDLQKKVDNLEQKIKEKE